MGGESVGEVVAVTLHLDQVQRQGELVAVQHPVLVVVGQPPHLAQHVARQLGLEELLLGGPAGDLAVVLLQAVENLVRPGPVPAVSALQSGQ